jgi:hypothetical protein
VRGGILVHDAVDRDSRQQIDVRDGIPLKKADELPPIRLDEEAKLGRRTGRARIERRHHRPKNRKLTPASAAKKPMTEMRIGGFRMIEFLQ